MTSCAGRTLLEILWEHLDSCVDTVIADEGEPEKWEDESGTTLPAEEVGVASEWMDWGHKRGKGLGVAYAIAVIQGWPNPNVEAVREVAMERAKTRWAE